MSALLSDRKCLNDERNPDCDEYLMAWDNAKRCPECRALRRNRLARERYALRQERQGKAWHASESGIHSAVGSSGCSEPQAHARARPAPDSVNPRPKALERRDGPDTRKCGQV